MNAATTTTPPAAAAPALKPLSLADPFRWLRLGWRDFCAAPAPGLFYGLAFTAMGWALLKVFEAAPAYLLALAAGFLLVGPALCLGLYRISQRLEAGESADFGDSLLAFRQRLAPLAMFALILLVLEMVWARVAMLVFALSFDNGLPDFRGSLLALLDPQNIGFIVAYLGVGALFAGLIYAFSVITMPMLLDRPVDVVTASLTSLRLVLAQPVVMLLWGLLISLIVGLALLPAFTGLIIVAPVIGHASWHAYRAAIS